MKGQKFPEDIQCIVEPVLGCGGIYISNIEAAQNPRTLKRYGIEAVITAIKGKNLDKILPSNIEYLYVPAVDHVNFDLSYYFQVSNGFIDEQRKRTNVLVHCMAGVSRSVTLVIAYLMKTWKKPMDNVYSFVKSKRPLIHPNQSFVAQLKKYEKSLLEIRNEVREPSPQIEKRKMSEVPQSKIQAQQKENNYDRKLKQAIRAAIEQKEGRRSKML